MPSISAEKHPAAITVHFALTVSFSNFNPVQRSPSCTIPVTFETGENFNAAFLRGAQHRVCERTVVDRRFIGPERRSFEFRTQRRFEFARIFWTQGFRFQSHSVMQRDQRA